MRSRPSRLIATLGANRRVDHLELFAGCQIVTLLSNHVDDPAPPVACSAFSIRSCFERFARAFTIGRHVLCGRPKPCWKAVGGFDGQTAGDHQHECRGGPYKCKGGWPRSAAAKWGFYPYPCERRQCQTCCYQRAYTAGEDGDRPEASERRGCAEGLDGARQE
jgi:hypothetical protein